MRAAPESRASIDATLAPDDADRATATLGRLRRSGLDFALTGGPAIAWHAGRGPVRGRAADPARRPLHDLDLVVADMRSIPDRLGEAFEIWHVHADALPGRMLVQLHDRSTSLRVDVFGARGATLSRCADASLRGTVLRIVSSEDLVARLGALLLDLALGEAVAPKHARDFSALVPRADPTTMAFAWADHRRGRHPLHFDDARKAVLRLVRTRPDLLVPPVSPFLAFPCPRCGPRPGPRPAAVERGVGGP